jgi:23S rRNA (pseudouridine1915-N3)-methyltransferase
MPKWVTEGYQEYAKRLPRECSLVLKEIDPAKRNKSAKPQQMMEEEAKRIQAAIPKGAHVVALDVLGKSWSTETLSENMKDWLQGGQDIALLIGGPDGLSPSCLQLARQRWSLSALTMPHPLVRVLLAEQLYRGWTLIQGHPYHRA